MQTNQTIRQTTKSVVKANFWRICGMLLLMLLVLIIIMGAFTYATTALFHVRIPNTLPLASYAMPLPMLPVLPILAMLLEYTVLAGMLLGLNSGLLGAVRGEHVRVTAVFSRMGKCFKGLRLMLWMELKTLLWMLPGLAVLDVPITLAANFSLPTEVITVFSVISYILMLALAIPAMLRYCMSFFIMTENPQFGVRTAVEHSKHIMRYRKWQFFKLNIPYYLIACATVWGLSLAGYAIVSITENTVLMMITAFIVGAASVAAMMGYLVYACAARTVFYNVFVHGENR